VIAIFTKYDQFKRDVGMKLEDQGRDPAIIDDEMERIFNKEFLANLKGSPPSVRLESERFYQLAYITLIAAVQECTSLANGALILSKRLQMHSPAASSHSCS
jgi:hypothetical protein